MDPSQVTELALRLGWLERLELAQRLLSSLHPQAEDSLQPVAKREQPPESSDTAPVIRQSIRLPNPIPHLEAERAQLDSIANSFRKLRDALESSLEP